MGGGTEELRRHPTVGLCSTVWTGDQIGRSSAKYGNPERLRRGTIQKEARYCNCWSKAQEKNSPSVLPWTEFYFAALFLLSCIGKRIKEDCDRGSEVWTVHSGAS